MTAGAREARAGGLRRMLPILAWVPSCTFSSIGTDIIAGLLTAAAGLSVYALFGSSKRLAVSATSGNAAMLAALVGPLAQGDSARHSELASTAYKLGFVSEFIIQ